VSTPPLEPTRRRTLAWAAAVGAALTWLAVAAVEGFDLVAPEVPWTTPVLLAVAAAAGVGLARVTWVRHHTRGRVVDPRQSVATLALARAMLLAGAAFTGGYLAFALYFAPRWEAPAPRARVVYGLVAVAASVALTAAGWALEYACRVPDPDDGPPGSDSEPDTDA